MDRIEQAFRVIAEELEKGQFTRSELEGIKLFAKHIVGATEKALARGPVGERIR